MGTVTGASLEKVQQIEAASVVNGEFVDGELILTKGDGTEINVGPLILKAPDNSLHRLVVANDGTLSTVPA